MIVVKNLTKVYKTRGREVRALDNVSFTLPDSGMVFIVGKSGSGKSTLLNMISGLDKFTSGQIISGGNSLEGMKAKSREKYLGSYIGYVFQDYRLIEDFTVKQNVELAADIAESGRSCEDYLKLVGLDGYENRLPKELSGGQKQRVAIARALIKSPKVILADEPTGNLDLNTTREILTLLKEISKDTLVLIVSHNLRDADAYADRIIELADGKVIKDKTRVQNYDNNLKYKNGVINLPHHKDLGNVELGLLLRGGRRSKSIVQNSGGFTPTENQDEVNENIKLHNKGMSPKNLFKVFSIIFKRKIFSKITTVLLAAVILSVFYVIQSLSMYNTTEAFLTTLENSDASSVIVQASAGTITSSKYVGVLNESKIEKLASGYNGRMYKLYSDYIYTHSNISVGGSGFVLRYYTDATVGTLNTTPEYAARLLGTNGIEVLAGNLYDKDYGVVITDYVADSIIANNPDRFSDMGTTEEKYQSLIGEFNAFYKTTYINAIINTNYESEHRAIKDVLAAFTTNSNLNELTTSSDYIEFMADVSERYGIAYSFSENYYNALLNYRHENFAAGKDALVFDCFYKRSDGVYAGTATNIIMLNNKLADGDLTMAYNIYNHIFETEYSFEDVFSVNTSFAPQVVAFEQYESSSAKAILHSQTVTVKGIGAATSVSYMNANTAKDFIKYNTFAYSVYLDNPSAVKDITGLISSLKFSMFSGRIGNIYFIERCVEIFENFFEVTMLFILVACVFFLVNFGIKSIRSNIYEIGVIKAMGGIKRDISLIFISQSLLMGVGILISTYFGMQIFSGIADTVFLESLAAVSNANFYGIRVINFYPSVALIDIVIALGVVVTSAVISTMSIDRLNLISILKAKE